MKYIHTIAFFLLLSVNGYTQENTVPKTKFVFGLSAPELLHAGVTHRLANISLIGFSVGAGPTWGGVWPTLNAEHRLYFSKDENRLKQKVWFLGRELLFLLLLIPVRDSLLI